MGALLRPEVYGDGVSPMTFDRKQLVPLLEELVGRRPVSKEYTDALAWLNDNVGIFANQHLKIGGGDLDIACRRYDVVLRRAAAGAKLCFYDRQLLDQIAECVHSWYGDTLLEGVSGGD